jgi:transcriptional regulator with XRE-family HTH domain
MPKQETFAEYLQRKMNESTPPITPTDIEKNTRKAIKEGTVRQILNGVTTNPTITTVQALARGLDVPLEEVVSAAFGLHRTEEEIKQSKVGALFSRSKELEEEDHTWFEQTMEMVEREVRRRIRDKRK